ncbi:tyrosine-type recombinase/integrase [Prosthecobacter sp.]|uniref:tyrosine-type recombinase/integrase n=1 Tax=Prosthecobacter sp. TaxID=1965333 RepID=UPI003784A410
MINGKRQRFFFKTKEEADTKAEQLRVAKKNVGEAAFSIPEKLRVEAIEAARLLEPYGHSLLDAVKFYLPHLQAEKKTIPWNQFVEEFLAAKTADGASGRYLQDLTNKLQCFAKTFGDRDVSSIDRREVDDWLRNLKTNLAKPVSALTRNNFRRVLVVAFNHAKFRSYCLENPVVGTAKAREIETPVGILSVPEISRLLQHAPAQLKAFLVIGAFAGLRRSEIIRLDWSNVDIEERFIEVTAMKAKSARRRLVRMRENLAAWLKDLVKSSGQVTPPNFKELLDSARCLAGIEQWPQNALRHSFASYALAHENNANALALDLGHSNTQLLFQHYREVVKPKDAAAYWNLFPGAGSIKSAC